MFDAYSRFEESVLEAKMAKLEEEPEEEEEERNVYEPTAQEEIDFRLARLEHLMERRPLLLSSVLLRQNPHILREWHARADICKDDPAKAIECYSDAVKTVACPKRLEDRTRCGRPLLRTTRPEMIWLMRESS